MSTKLPKPVPLEGLQGRKLAGTGSGHGSRSACGGVDSVILHGNTAGRNLGQGGVTITLKQLTYDMAHW